MGSSLDQEIASLAQRQHGVFSREQALELGASEKAIRTRTIAGRWQRVHRGVFLVGGAAVTWRSRLLAACLLTGGLASHRSAALLWRIDGSRVQRPEVVVPRGKRFCIEGVTVHESKDFDRCEATVIDGIPVTGRLRTVLDLGAVLSSRRVAQSVDHVLRTGQASLDELWQVHTRHRRRGRNGTGVLASVLEDETRTRAIPESFFERLVFDLLVDAGLPTPVPQVEVRDGGGRFVARVDLAYPEHKVAIELLGKQFHHTERAFEEDPARRNRLEVLGWTVLEFTWRLYADRPNRLCSQVAAALRS